MTNIDDMTVKDARKYIEYGLAIEAFLTSWDDIRTNESEDSGEPTVTIKSPEDLVLFVDNDFDV